MTYARTHHPNSRRFICGGCGEHHEWPNRDPNKGRAGRSRDCQGGLKTHTRPWLTCYCGWHHVRGKAGAKEFAAVVPAPTAPDC